MSVTLVQGTTEYEEDATQSHDAALPVTATAGNLLLTFISFNKDASGLSSPAGFSTAIEEGSGSDITLAFAWKVSDGTEQAITWFSGVSDTSSLKIVEYSGIDSPVLDVFSTDNSGGNDTSSQSTGTTALPSKAISTGFTLMGVDSTYKISEGSGASWDNGYSQVEYSSGASRNNAAFSYAIREVLTASTQESTFTAGSGSDQMAAIIVVFNSSVTPSGTPLSVDDITSGQTVSPPTLTQTNALTVDSVTSDQGISESLLLTGVQLSVNSIVSDQLVGQPSLDQNNIFQVNPVLSEQAISSPIFTQANILSVDSLTTGQTLSQVVLSIAGVLSVDGISTAQTIANIELIEHSLLSVNDISSDQSVGNVTLVSGDQLVVQSITNGQEISGTNFTQHNIILVDTITNTQFIGVVNIGGDDKNIGIISVGFKSADIGVKYGILNITVQFKE